ncbi:MULTISPECIES: dehydrogenase [unclassified Streptomyces]|uniref:dehydrogenase n=1 Tax=unclassified Streptomyces TaxID=2593676 RepID=UPI001F0330BB|nr:MULTISPECIES: dehydrogenase [unclassified Streptomyces]
MPVSTWTPVGRWTGTVTHDGEVDDYTVTFEPDGSLTVVTKKSTGTGSWTVTGDDSLEFSLREDFNVDITQISPNGHHAAYIQIDISAQRDGETIAGEGKAVVHGPDDVVIYATDAQTEARRVS